MSEYPAVPQYGALDIPGYGAPTMGAIRPSSSQYSYQSSAQAGGLSNGVESSPHTNAYSYNANAQNEAKPVQGLDRTYAKPPSQAFSHVFTSSSYPSTPSVPLENSQTLQAFVQPLENQIVPRNRTQYNFELSELAPSIGSQHSQIEHPKRMAPAASDLEDGEVDDEGIDISSILSQEHEMGLKFPPESQQKDNDKKDNGGQSHKKDNVDATDQSPVQGRTSSLTLMRANHLEVYSFIS